MSGLAFWPTFAGDTGCKRSSRIWPSSIWWFACDVMHGHHDHGGDVGGQEQYDFSPQGVNCHFYANYVSKFSFVLSTSMVAMQIIYGIKVTRIHQIAFDDSNIWTWPNKTPWDLLRVWEHDHRHSIGSSELHGCNINTVVTQLLGISSTSRVRAAMNLAVAVTAKENCFSLIRPHQHGGVQVYNVFLAFLLQLSHSKHHFDCPTFHLNPLWLSGRRPLSRYALCESVEEDSGYLPCRELMTRWLSQRPGDFCCA